MRARLIMKLIGLVVTVVISIITFRSFSLSSSSPLQPSKLVGNAVSGLCADNQAIAAAGGGGTGAAGTGAGGTGAAVSPANPATGSSNEVGNATGIGNATGMSALGGSSGGLAPLVSDVGLAPSVLSCPTTTLGSGG